MKAKGLGILSALTASVCCLGPFVLILAGLGSLGLGAVIGKYHWYFVLTAALLVGIAWRSYFKEKKSCEAKLCEMEGQKMTKAILLVATTVVLTFAGLNLYTYAKSSPAQELNAQGVQMDIPVEGMTCFTCETTVQSAVSKLPGIYDVKASAKEKTAWVSYDPKKTSPEHIITAINETGFKAQKPNL